LTNHTVLNPAVQLGSAQLNYIQLIAFEEADHVSDPVFSAKLWLLRHSLGLDFGFTIE